MVNNKSEPRIAEIPVQFLYSKHTVVLSVDSHHIDHWRWLNMQVCAARKLYYSSLGLCVQIQSQVRRVREIPWTTATEPCRVGTTGSASDVIGLWLLSISNEQKNRELMCKSLAKPVAPAAIRTGGQSLAAHKVMFGREPLARASCLYQHSMRFPRQRKATTTQTCPSLTFRVVIFLANTCSPNADHGISEINDWAFN